MLDFNQTDFGRRIYDGYYDSIYDQEFLKDSRLYVISLGVPDKYSRGVVAAGIVLEGNFGIFKLVFETFPVMSHIFVEGEVGENS